MIDVLSLKDEYSPVVVRKWCDVAPIETPKPKRRFSGKIPAITSALLTPTTAFAADTSATFIRVYDAVMNIMDHAVVLVIVFAGGSWMLGHRTKAIELLLSAAIGYIIVMNALEIRDFLKGLAAP